MKYRRVASCLVSVIALGLCGASKIIEERPEAYGKLPRPERIYVYDFAASAADVPAESVLAGQASEKGPALTDQEITTGREVGAKIASKLADRIRDMGLPASVATAQTTTQVNDIVIRGYLISIEEGEAKKRFAIGFKSGESELKTAVEGFEVTAKGLRKLGSGEVDSTSTKAPGAGAGLAMDLATHNPLGLIVSTGFHAYEEKTGKSTMEGRIEDTAKEIAGELRKAFVKQGWIKE